MHSFVSHDGQYAVSAEDMLTFTPECGEWVVSTSIWKTGDKPELMCKHQRRYSKGHYVWMCSAYAKWSPVAAKCIINYPNNIDDKGASFVLDLEGAECAFTESPFILSGWDSAGNAQ